MPKVKFVFDKEKDLYNIWDTCNFTSKWSDDFKNGIPEQVLKLCGGKKFEEIREQLKKYQEKIHSSALIPVVEESYNGAWAKIGPDFFARLEKITKHPICFDHAFGYLTIVGRCPYNYNKKNPYFYVNLFNGIHSAMKTTAHEIMHIQFHNTYWPEVEKRIGKEKTADLKEALTVLLNLEFRDLWIVKDEGYPVHEELRAFIEQEWKKHKDFDILIKECVNYLKKT